MNAEKLGEICNLVVELTKLRQAECKHLCIEEFAPELLRRLVIAAEQEVFGPLTSRVDEIGLR